MMCTFYASQELFGFIVKPITKLKAKPGINGKGNVVLFSMVKYFSTSSIISLGKFMCSRSINHL